MLPKLRKDGDLATLLELLGRDGAVVVELGAFAGDGTRQLLACEKVARVYAVDAWVGGYDASDQASGADMAEAEAAFDLVAASDARVRKVKATTIEAIELVPDDLDLVYLDADHRYESVLADLIAWRWKVRRDGGLLAGHDYTDPGHPGVQRAVDEVLGPPDYVFPDTSWAKEIR